MFIWYWLFYNKGLEVKGEKFNLENLLLCEGYYLNKSKGSFNLYNVYVVRLLMFFMIVLFFFIYLFYV